MGLFSGALLLAVGRPKDCALFQICMLQEAVRQMLQQLSTVIAPIGSQDPWLCTSQGHVLGKQGKALTLKSSEGRLVRCR